MTANDASAGEPAAVPPLPGAIDVHAHFITDRLRAAMQAAGHGEPDGMPAIPDWDPEAALTHMDAVGVRTAMLSVSSPGVDFGDAGATRELARSVNDEGAELVRAHPGRFGLMASLPLPDIPAALAEAEYALDRLGADGIVLKTHYQGRYLGDPHYEPLMDLLDERRAVVCLHPTSPQCWQDTSLGYPRPMVEFAFDTTRAVAHLIMSGTLRRHPGISFIVPHAGAALPVLADRIAVFALMQAEGPPAEVLADLATLHFDLAGFALPRALPALLQLTDTRHLLYGSDFPFTPGWAVEGLARNLADAMDPATREDMLRHNASRLFPRLQEGVCRI
ncbi:amidohydrolase family protein [Streptomyces sp. NPDC102264]|uniref:amidohydrolase family protein n=1 Tax=Streptomyces sp. NPDC102264 TaxID=3366149 RepID=UPI00381A2070